VDYTDAYTILITKLYNGQAFKQQREAYLAVLQFGHSVMLDWSFTKDFMRTGSRLGYKGLPGSRLGYQGIPRTGSKLGYQGLPEDWI